ncbi:site-specific integrase [Bacillus sp. BH2]|uniref:site-specific integrase n=1 Tax=Bacillus sp. BH2 TaxID=2528958 RepID=UPI0010659B1F|nr:site-specific integrase [Bacillus sp. BH2]TEA48097.1 site-specific integrase [Bacillus sp. BH2]
MTSILNDSKEYIDSISENVFNEESIKDSKDKFNHFQLNGIIKKGAFEDDEWMLDRQDQSNCNVFFRFQEISDLNVTQCVKCWIIELITKFTTSYVRGLHSFVKQAILISDNFNESNIEKLISAIENKKSNRVKMEVDVSDETKRNFISAVMNFLDYSHVDTREGYFNELWLIQQKYNTQDNIRDLPVFEDVYIFKYLIEFYFEKEIYLKDKDEKLFYFPIYLWWKITTIIPMRPSEFCAIKREGIFYKDKKCFITIPRKKQKRLSKHVDVIDKIEVNKEIYLIIKWYINNSRIYGSTETLVSYLCYRSLLENYFPNFNHNNYNIERFQVSNLYLLLNKFYEQIVIQRFGLKEIDRIKLNDTRHFAFCSMILQGFNRLTIARYGGHLQLDSQYHYQQHLDYFIQSQIYHLTTIYKNRNVFFNDEVSDVFLQDIKNNFFLTNHPKTGWEKMDYGYCTDSNMECESTNCVFCTKWWISKEEFKKHEKEIRNLQGMKEERIRKRKNFILNLRKKMFIDLENLSYDPVEQETLTRETKLLNGEIEDLAKLNSWL